MLPIPDVTPSPAWDTAWLGFELDMMSKARAASVVRSRRSTVMILARHASAAGLDPEQITKPWLTRYLIDQGRDRQGAGAGLVFQQLKIFFGWLAVEYQVSSPMQGIPQPRGRSRTVPVVGAGEFAKVLRACQSPRDTAIVTLLVESGLRRFELAALDVADVDLKAHTVTVRCGKGGKARVAVFGDDSAQTLWRWLRQRGSPGGPLFTSARGDRLAQAASPDHWQDQPRVRGAGPSAPVQARMGSFQLVSWDCRGRSHAAGRVVQPGDD